MNKLVFFLALFSLVLWGGGLGATDSLARIEAKIQQLVIEQNEAQGLEIYIARPGEVLYQKTWGWKDRDRAIPLESGMIYNVRSMTKPMIGALIHVYQERGFITLDDPVSKYLDAFDNELVRNLTIRQMLLHRAGYIQGMPGKSWLQYPDLKSMVDYWGQNGPQNPGNTNWSYADAHADILAHLLEEISAKSLRTLIHEELLGPLSMYKSYAAWSNEIDTSLVMPLYRGSAGNWRRLWQISDGAFYPFAMGAQSVFCTAEDYAKFMFLFMEKGEQQGKQIIPKEGVEEIFANRDLINLPPGIFPLADGASLYYGHFWGMVLYPQEEDRSLPSVFLHQGSDGTAAYGFPDREIVVLIMTQSRGTRILPKMERLIMPLLKEVYN